MKNFPTYKLNEEAQNALKALVNDSITKINEPIDGSAKLVADIYTGRDPLGAGLRMMIGEGIPVQAYNDALSTKRWSPPETTANLFLSRIRQILTTLTPGVPTIKVRSRTPGAAYAAEHQNELMRFMTDRGELREAMRKAAFTGLLSPFFGIKLAFDLDAKYAYDKVKFETIEPHDCGYEPFQRRFSWHSYDKQWADLPKDWRPDVTEPPKDWDTIRITEVYHEGFKHGAKKMEGCPMSIFVSIGGEDSDTTLGGRKEDISSLGTYTTTVELPACPLVLGNFLDPAPAEDVPASEVLSWIPLMRMIVQVLVQINREITTVNKTILFDKAAVSDDALMLARDAVPGATVFIGVDADDATRGVNATMRPVEQNSVLNEYLAALTTYMRLFDDVTGVSPQDRGMPVNPRKSATEAAAITDAASRRNQDRLEVMAMMWSRLSQALFKFQRIVCGKVVPVPLENGIVREVPVPNPVTACYAFEVDPIELGHMSRRGDLDALMNWLTVTTNTQQAFQTGMPRLTRETLRRLGKSMGIEDVDLYLDAPVLEEGPENRYIAFLQTGKAINVYPQDQHEMYIAYYQKMLDKVTGESLFKGGELVLISALEKHAMFAQQLAEATSQKAGGEVVPGMGAGAGSVDNNIAAQLQAGATPSAVPQGTGGY
jgi:hypothetical protein|tara:strand:- start:6849 stop:8819 length:1971 start_codon:yes stop_codon:yes gene_type:complete